MSEELTEARVIEALTDEELHLAHILLDESGIDQAEMLWRDDTKPDLCYRLYPYQYPWWRSKEDRQMDHASRDIGKSEGLMARALAFPFCFPNQEMALITPEYSHVDTISERIEARIKGSWFYSALTRSGRNGITHRPFKILWQNGARLLSRLPQRSGIGVKSLHSVRVELDEAQDLSRGAWAETPSIIRWDVPGARWYIHGVSKGVRDDFYDYSTNPDKGFKVHRITKMHKPGFDRAKEEADNGGRDSGDYKRNVKGEPGNVQNLIFLLDHLMKCSDTDESSPYNTTEYVRFDIRASDVQARADARGATQDILESSDHHIAALQEMLDFPAAHRERYSTFWAGMDVGLVSDPTEILIAAEYHPDAAERRRDKAAAIAVPVDGQSRLKVLARISLREIPAPLQADVVMWIIDRYKPKAFAMDSTGLGLPVFDELQKRAGRSVAEGGTVAVAAEDRRNRDRARAVQALTVIKGYNFSGKVVVSINEEEAEKLGPNATPQDIAEKAGVKQWTRDAGTDALRAMVDTARMLLPDDRDLIGQWNGQTWSYSSEAIDAYGRRRAYSKGTFHVLDAGRMLALGHKLDKLEAFLKQPPKKAGPVRDHFG